MKNYKITLQYEGSRYDGWQKQGNTGQTIQGKLETVLERMAGEPVEVHGSGRTDAGVHAKGQTANFHLSFEAVSRLGDKPEQAIQDYLNRYLPEDIAVLQTEEVPERFHSRLNAAAKRYCYQICTAQKRDVFSRRTCYGLGKQLDVEAMRRAAALLCGEHDFRSFCGNKKMKKSTVRILYEIKVEQTGEMVHLSFLGNGFLQNMVRILAGTLIEVGLGKRSWQSVQETLEQRNRQAAGFMAPPEGLCLEQVFCQLPITER